MRGPAPGRRRAAACDHRSPRRTGPPAAPATRRERAPYRRLREVRIGLEGPLPGLSEKVTSTESRQARLRFTLLGAHAVELHAAVDPLQPPFAGKRPAVAVGGGLLDLLADEDAARIGDGRDSAGEVHRAPVPVSAASERGA